MQENYTQRIAEALERIADAIEADMPEASETQTAAYGDGGLGGVRPNSSVTFTYQGVDDSYPRQRRVWVEKVYPSTQIKDVSEIVGIDQDTDKYRTFRSDRIKSPILKAG